LAAPGSHSGQLIRWRSQRGDAASTSLVGLAAGVAVFVLPFVAYATAVLHAFYMRGSSFYDAGWYAYLIHDANLTTLNPLWIDNSHVQPLFLLTASLGHLLAVSRIQYYAAYIGISHTLPGLAIFWLLIAGYRMTTPLRCLAAVLLGLVFAFDGLALAIAQYPHYMMFLVGTGLMFLVALVLRRLGIALVFFLLCLSAREDAGFHLFALLAAAFLLQWWRGAPRGERKPIAVFAAAALIYSCGAVALQHALTGNSLLIAEYLGNPPFASVTLSSMATRLLGWVVYRRYVVFPALAALAWAIARRNPQIILGYAAFLPWGLLHLAAAKPMLGTLPSYYAFPFVFASAWPLIGLMLERRGAAGARSILEPVCGFALLTAASFMPSPYQHDPTHIDLPADFVSPPSLSRQVATDRALVQLAGARQLGREVVDQSVRALAPECYHNENDLFSHSHLAPDSIIYFAAGFESRLARRTAAEAGLDRTYAVPGTAIRVASNRALQGVKGLIELPSAR
jgi:hypothetical protein